MPKSLKNCTLYLAEEMGTSRNRKRTSSTDLFATQNKHFKSAYESSELPGKLTPNNDMSNNSDTEEHPDTNKSTPINDQKIDPTSPPNVKSSFESGLLKAELEDDDSDPWGIETSDQGHSILNSSSLFELPEYLSKQTTSSSEISDRLTKTFFYNVEKINSVNVDETKPTDHSTITGNTTVASYNESQFHDLSCTKPPLKDETNPSGFISLAHEIEYETKRQDFAHSTYSLPADGVEDDLDAEEDLGAEMDWINSRLKVL